MKPGGAALPEVSEQSDPWQSEGVRLHAESRRKRWKCRARPVSLGGKECQHLNIDSAEDCSRCGCPRSATRAREKDELPPDTNEDGERITQRLTIAKAVEVYQTQVGRITAAFAEIHDAEAELNAAFCAGEKFRGMHVPTHHQLSFSNPEYTLKDIRRQAWDCLVDLLEVRRMMSIKRAKELDEMLKQDEMPELTLENATAMVQSFQSNLETMLREAVEEVFNWLRPPNSRYKTNTELEVGERVVLTWMVESGWGRSAFHVNYNYEANLTALENVFSALDGRGQITKTHRSAISNAVGACDADGKGQTEYFAFRCFKNRNLHLRFKRLDLLARFNAIAGGKRLRPAS